MKPTYLSPSSVVLTSYKAYCLICAHIVWGTVAGSHLQSHVAELNVYAASSQENVVLLQWSVAKLFSVSVMAVLLQQHRAKPPKAV